MKHSANDVDESENFSMSTYFNVLQTAALLFVCMENNLNCNGSIYIYVVQCDQQRKPAFMRVNRVIARIILNGNILPLSVSRIVQIE